jgi:hypothetical protein
MASTCTEHGTLEVVDESFLQVLPGVDGVWLEAFKLGERCGFQCQQEVDNFGYVGAAQNFNGSVVAANPLSWVLFAILLGDANWLELPWAVAGGDVASEGWEAITIVDVVWVTATLVAPRVDDISSIKAFVDFLP